MYKTSRNSFTNKGYADIWDQAFRPFFLAGALFSILALGVWGGVLTGMISASPYGGPVFWHAHEMLFGFGAAIVCGFLLTAVQNWTGLRATHGHPLAALFAIWLAARTLMALDLPGMQWLLVVVDLSFFPVLSVLSGRLLISVRSYRNLGIPALLMALALANLLTHASLLFDKPQLFSWGAYSAVFLITLLIVIIGGRVIPMFTASGTQTAMVAALPWLEYTAMSSSLLIAFLYASQLVSLVPDYVLSIFFAVAALSHGYRAARWRIRVALKTPLVWSLHLAYWFIPLGYTLFALHYVGFDIRTSAALHGLTAGAMATIMLAMITRVSLGHTGRSFNINNVVALSFGLVVLAGITRLLGGLFPSALGIHAYGLAIILWIAAYGIFFINNLKPLATAHPNG